MGKIAENKVIAHSNILYNNHGNTVIKEKRMNLFGSKNLGVTVSKPSVLGARSLKFGIETRYYRLLSP
jgi:hypothetical protein